MRFGTIGAVLCAMANLGLASSAFAQNRLSNGSFDTDLSGWSLLPPSGSQPVWSSKDCCGNSASGSAELRAVDLPVILGSSCIAVSGGSTYDLVAMVDTQPAGAGIPTQAGLGVLWYSDAACTDAIDPPQTWSVGNSPGWRRFGVSTHAPAAALSARIELTAAGAGLSSGIDAYFDQVAFGTTGTVPVTLQSFDID